MEVLDRGDMDSIITWLPHGRAFIVRHSQKLKEIVLPRFFKQSKFMSFTRQLNLWGFKRITKGTDAGAYYHELFLRGRPLLSTLMRRQKIKGTGIKLTPNPDTEPNFYKISDKRPLPANTSKREPEPLPPISTTASSSRPSTKPRTMPLPQFPNNSTLDMYLHQQRMEQQNNLTGLNPMGRLGGGSFSCGMPSHNTLSFKNNLGFEILRNEAHRRPMQRLSAPVTSSDFNLVARSIEKKTKEHHAIASAQQLLSEVGGHAVTSPVENHVDDLKQKLLHAWNALDQQSQGGPPPPAQHQPSIEDIMSGHHRHQHVLGQPHGLPPSQAGLSSLYSGNTYNNNRFPQLNKCMPPPQHQYHQHQHNPFYGQAVPHPSAHSQSEPSRESLAALMTALDQTRQVAAAAQAQSSLLQQVANDLAHGRHTKK